MPRNRNRRDRYVPPPEAYAPVSMPVPAPVFLPQVSVGVQTLGSKNATVARVTLTRPGEDCWSAPVYQFEASESAKREQGDKYDPQTGELLALSRAFTRLGRQMASEANKRVQAMVDEKNQASLNRLMKAHKAPVHRRTREEWEQIQAQRGQAGAEQIAANLGLTREEFTTREEWNAQRGVSKAEEWGGRQARLSATPYDPELAGRQQIDLRDGRVITVEGNQVVLYEPGEDDFQRHRRVLIQD